MCLKNVLLSLIFNLLMVSSGFAQFCEGTLYSNLLPGDTAVVVVEGDTLNVRANPGLNGKWIAELEADTLIHIVSGPRCADGYAWYQGEFEAGQLGWMAESSDEDYYLGRLPREYITYTTLQEIQPNLSFTYPSGIIEHITQDANFAHGRFWNGASTILYLANGDAILINVIAVEELEADSTNAMLFNQLNYLIDLNSDEAFTQIPAFPNTMGEPRQLLIQPNYVHFQNGSGIRYLAVYFLEELYVSINYDSFEYTFHGLTDDGRYYVNVSASGIATPELPLPPPENPNDPNVYAAQYDAWLAEVETFLNSIAPASFAPHFSMIEGIIQSIEVDTKSEP